MFHGGLFDFYAMFTPKKTCLDFAGRVELPCHPLLDPVNRPPSHISHLLTICQVVTEVHVQLETESVRIVTTCLG